MRVCFVSRGKLQTFRQQDGEQRADIYLFGFQGIGEVSYEKELKGETDFFSSAALLSKTYKSVVVCGCVTNTCGHKRKSAVVAENGKICGVSDALHSVDGGCGCGAALRVYETKAGKMGVIVDEDLYFPDVIKALAMCGSDFIVCPFDGATDGLQSVLLRASAYYYGVPLLFCADGYGMIADSTGEALFASPQSPVSAEFGNRKEYHLVETRRRGFYPTKSLKKRETTPR